MSSQVCHDVTEEVEQESCKPVTRDGECKQVMIVLMAFLMLMLMMLRMPMRKVVTMVLFRFVTMICLGADQGLQEGDRAALHQAGGQSAKGGPHHHHHHHHIKPL